MVTTLDKFGRIVIPKRVREDFGLEPGSTLEIAEEGDRIVLRPRRVEPDLVVDRGILVFTGEAQADLEQYMERQRQERLISVASWRGR